MVTSTFENLKHSTLLMDTLHIPAVSSPSSQLAKRLFLYLMMS